MTHFAALSGPVLHAMNQLKLLPVEAMPTMLPTWNRMCRDEGGGVGPAYGWHIIIAGNTGQGKSLLGLNVAAHAMFHGAKVGYVSLEMSEMQLATRLQAIIGCVDIRHLEHGNEFNEAEAAKAVDAVELIHEQSGGEIYTNDEPLDTLSDVELAISILHEQGCKVFVVDYLQLAWTGDADSIARQVTEVSHAMRKIAKRLNILSIGISQFNRSVSSQHETPIVQGLMGGSSLENDADQVLILDHSSYKLLPGRSATVNLLLAKNRHGSTGKIPCRWDYRTLRIEEETDREPPY